MTTRMTKSTSRHGILLWIFFFLFGFFMEFSRAEEIPVLFRNELPYNIELYWEGANQERVLQSSIDAGYQLRARSHPGHTFSYDDSIGKRHYVEIPNVNTETTVLLKESTPEPRGAFGLKPPPIVETPDILVLICTQSFTGEELVEDVLLDQLLDTQAGWRIQAKLVDDVGIDWTESGQTSELVDLSNHVSAVLVVASTYGDGDPPNHATEFADWLDRTTSTNNNNTTSLTTTVPHFAVFGLGDSTYAHFNSFGTFIDESLEDRGGQRLMELYKGDAQEDLSGDFRQWTEQVTQTLLRILPKREETPQQKKYQSPFSSTGFDWRRSAIPSGSNTTARLVGKEQLLQDDVASRSVLHISFDVAADHISVKDLQPGDHMGIYPRNENDVVQRVLKWLDIRADMMTKILERQGDLWVERTISAYEFLTAHIDLAGRASPSSLRALLPFVGTLELRALARDLTYVETKSHDNEEKSIRKSSNFINWVGGRRLSKFDLAVLFECRPSLQAFARAIGPMQPRLYSVATVNQTSAGQTKVGICLSIADGGLCSNYVANMKQNSDITVFFRKSQFHFVADGTPTLLIAAGSGVGPYVGFLENILQNAKTTGSVETALSNIRLGFGCRTPADILYKDRLDGFDSYGSQIYYAYSRAFGQPRARAQDIIRKEKGAVWEEVFENRGRVFACGRLEICESVREALEEVAMVIGKMKHDEAHFYVQTMEKEGRLLTDCWSVDPPDPLQLKKHRLQYPVKMVNRLERHHAGIKPPSISQNRSVDLSSFPEWPSYLRLLASGEFERRVNQATNMFSACVACGRFCEVDRLSRNPEDWGECRVGEKAIVSAVDAHFGEEDCLVGTHGSGTIFFGACNLKCMYCQNWKLSFMDQGNLYDAHQLADSMLALQERGCHNINLVSPTHNVLPIVHAVFIAAQNGLKLPIIWNTGGYDSVASLRLLDGIIDIYMPDAKYASRAVARKLSRIDNYPEINQAAIKEMHRQVGELQIDPRTGLAYRGVLVRHLVLPNDYGGSHDVTAFLANEVSKNTYTNVNDYYRPEHEAATDKKFGMNRKPTIKEKYYAHQVAREASLKRLHWEKRLYPNGRPYPEECSSCQEQEQEPQNKADGGEAECLAEIIVEEAAASV